MVLSGGCHLLRSRLRGNSRCRGFFHVRRAFTRFGLPVRGWMVLVLSYWLACFSDNLSLQGNRHVHRDGHGMIMWAHGRLLILGHAAGHSTFVMGGSFTYKVQGQLDLFKATAGMGVQGTPSFVLAPWVQHMVHAFSCAAEGAEWSGTRSSGSD